MDGAGLGRPPLERAPPLPPGDRARAEDRSLDASIAALEARPRAHVASRERIQADFQRLKAAPAEEDPDLACWYRDVELEAQGLLEWEERRRGEDER